MNDSVNANAGYDEDDYLHLGALILDYLRFFLRRWYLLLGLMGLCAGAFLAYNMMTYSPYYSASVYYTVEQTTSVTTNALIAERVAAGVSTVTSTADYRQDLMEVMGDKYQSIPYSIYAVATDSANLFTLTINCMDPEYVNELIFGVEQILPEWISRAFGCNIRTYSKEQLSNGIPVNSWSKVRVILYGLILGGFIWFVIASVFVFSIRRIHGEEDMYQVTSAACFGMLPEVAKKKRSDKSKDYVLITDPHIDKSYLQSLNSLRARMERKMRESGQKVFLFSSTKPEEGKSSLAINLALSLKGQGKRVLLINCDMRKKQTAEIFLYEEDQLGISDYLMGRTNKTAKFVVPYEKNLQVIPAGRSCAKFCKSPDFQRMKALLEALEEWADVILIDTPPTEYFGDAILLSEYVDSVFYVIRGDYAQVKEIRKGIEPFYQNNKLGGYILNQITLSHTIYGYHYGYGGKYSKYRNYSEYGHYGSYGIEEDEDERPIAPTVN